MTLSLKKRKAPRQAAFLASYAVTASITRAAKAAKISRDSHYLWLADDPAYPALFKAAKVRAADVLKDEAVRRAHDGVFEPNTYKGQFVYPVKGYAEDGTPIYGKKPIGTLKYSDRLMERLMTALDPDFRERAAIEVSGPNGGPLEIVEKLNAARDRLAKTNEGHEPEPGIS